MPWQKQQCMLTQARPMINHLTSIIVTSLPGLWSCTSVSGIAKHPMCKMTTPREGYNYYLVWLLTIPKAHLSIHKASKCWHEQGLQPYQSMNSAGVSTVLITPLLKSSACVLCVPSTLSKCHNTKGTTTAEIIFAVFVVFPLCPALLKWSILIEHCPYYNWNHHTFAYEPLMFMRLLFS